MAEININNISKNKKKKLLLENLNELNNRANLDLSYNSSCNVVSDSVSSEENIAKLLQLAVAKSGSRSGIIGLFYTPRVATNKDGIFISFIKGHGLHLKRKKINEFYYISTEALKENIKFLQLSEKIGNFANKLNCLFNDENYKNLLIKYLQYLDDYYTKKKECEQHKLAVPVKEENKKKNKKKKNKQTRSDINRLKEIKKIDLILWSKLYREIHKLSQEIYSTFINDY